MKKGLIAAERDRPALRRARSDRVGRQRFMQLAPHRLVFVEETSGRTDLTRLHGRAPKGKRLIGTAPFGLSHTQTLIAGLTCEGPIVPWVIPGAMDRPAFDTWVETQFAPRLAPGTVVILDNLSVHRSPRAVMILKANASCFLPLPA